MARFSAAERNEFLAIRAACYQETGVAELLAVVSRSLQHLIGADAFCSSQVDPATMLLMSAVTDGWPAEAKPLLLEHVFLASRAADIPYLFRQERRAIDVDDLLSYLEEPQADPYFQYHLLPFGYRHETELICSVRGKPQAFLTLSRREGSGRPDERLLRIAEAAAPHVAAGVARATVRETLASPTGTDIGMIVLDEHGTIELANSVAESWLFADSNKHWPLGLSLYATMVAKQLLAGSLPPNKPLTDLTHPDSGALYRLHWERHLGADERFRIIILLEPVRLGESREALLRLGLTKREGDVTIALLQGATVKEIAARLRVSPHTISEYMKSVFLKLNVTSRRELAAVLMGLSGPPPPPERTDPQA